MDATPARARPAHPEASPKTAAHARRQPWVGLAHLGVVYVVWGSTYLAIRVAVREGSGFPPFVMSGSRLLVAGILMLLIARLAGRRVRLTRHELAVVAGSGLMLWVGGNGMTVWAEQHADSGYAALLLSAVPIWTVLVESLLDRRLPTPLLVISLLVGLAGVGVLSAQGLSGTGAEPASVVALLAATISWTGGSLLQQRRKVPVPPLTSSAYQLLAGGLGLIVLSVLSREPTPHPIPEALLAWGYLVVIGSLLAFTSFVQVLQLLPTALVMTYAYVNPVIALLLGAVLLGEPITGSTIVGMVLVIVGVFGVFRVRATPAH